MTAKILRFPSRLAPLAKATPGYPLPCDGLHLVGNGDGWMLTRHAGGQSVAMRLTHAELLRIGDMIDDAFTLRAVEVLVRRGRARGIGVTLVTQRSASINKGVLTQVSTLILGRTISPQDRAAVKLWVDAHGTDGEKKDFWESIVSLPTKEKWVWSPARNVFARAAIRARETFDSSFTPKVGDKRMAPRQLAPVDLEVLRTRIAETIERAKADDPRELRKVIADLKKQIAAKPAAAPAEVQTIAVSVFSEVDINRLEVAARAIADAGRFAADATDTLMTAIARAKVAPKPAPTRAAAPSPVAPAKPRSVAPKTKRAASSGGDSSALGKCERAVLAALATHGTLNKFQIAILAGYSVTSGSLKNAFGALRSTARVVGGGDAITITEAGLGALGDFEPLPTGRALLDYWLDQAGGKCERTVLQAVIAAHPRALTREELSIASGYPETSGSLKNALGRLRSLKLITKGGVVALTETLGEAANA